MWIFAWFVLGLVAALVGSKLFNPTGKGLRLDIAIGFGGAMAAGLIFQLCRTGEMIGFSAGSLIVAVIGTIFVLFLYHSIRQGRLARSKHGAPSN